jgi:hypothetical protein
VSHKGTRQSVLCRVPDGRHSAQTLRTRFAECLSVDTRQRGLCRVPNPGHSAKCIFYLKKKSLSSARDLALGKDCFVGSKPSTAALFPLTLSISPLSPAARRSPPHRADVVSPRAPPGRCHAARRPHAATVAAHPHRPYAATVAALPARHPLVRAVFMNVFKI